MATAKANAPIDGFGIGTSLTTSSDTPALDCAYKLQEYAGRPRRKHALGKATLPGPKQVWRRYGPDGRMAGDTLSVENDDQEGEALIHLVLQAGKRVSPCPTLSDIRAHAARELQRLPTPLRELRPKGIYQVQVGEALADLTVEFDRHLTDSNGNPHAREDTYRGSTY
jgi:nicotinate phosphoribosyltransferase